jgi:flagellar hook protein FlgE
MLLSMDSGVSALDQFQQQLNVIGNNIANVNTTGFKSATVEFADALSETLGANAVGAEQVGTGVVTSSIAKDFTTGSFTNTGVATNMAINGNGFFMVKDPASGQNYVTQDGNFSVDTSGYLVTTTGLRVQGYTDATHTTIGDVRVSNADAPGGDTSLVQSYQFNSDGSLSTLLQDGTQYDSGQVLLQNYTTPTELVSVGNHLYTNMANAGPLPIAVPPSTDGLGDLVIGSLEMSNVDLAAQLTALITTQRAYEANTKVITTSDDILQDLVNLKR